MDHHFDPQIRSAQEQLEALLARADAVDGDDERVIREAVDEISASLEALLQQNQEMAAARREIESERARYQSLFEHAPDGYVVTNAEGVIKEANHTASEMLGLPRDSLAGKPLVLFIEDADQSVFFTQMAQLRSRNWAAGALSFELRMHTRTGSRFFASVTSAPIHKDGVLVGLRWSLRDIAVQKRAERRQRRLLEENQQQRAFLERLMEAAPVAIAVVRGEDHRYDMANARYRRMAGEDQPVVGRTFGEVFPEVVARRSVELIDEVYQTGTTVSVHEWSAPADSERDWGYRNIDLVPLWESDGSIQGVLIVAQDITPQVRSRRQIERLAVESQRQADELNAVFEAMNDAVIVYDREGTPIRANPRAVEVYGLDPVGEDWADVAEQLEIRTPDGQPAAVEDLPSSRALRGQRVDRARYHFQNAEGEALVIVASAAPLESDGRPSGAVVVWHDITEQERLLTEVGAQRHRAKAFSERLKAERDTLQTIMDSTHAQLAYLDSDFNFIAVNDAYAKGAGYDPEELLGRPHFELFPHRENQAIFEQVRDTGEAAVFHAKPYEHPNQGMTYWDWSLVPVKDPETGEVRGVVFSLLDVTEREELMVALEEERAKLEAIIRNAPEGIVVADAQARIQLTNPAADEIYGRDVPYGEGFESHASLQLCRPDGTPVAPRDLPLTRSALDGEICRNVEMVLIRPGGERRHLLVNTRPIRGAHGDVTGAIGAFGDISERKKMESEVARYAEQLQVLHEIDRVILAARSAEEIAAVTLPRIHALVPYTRATVELFDLDVGRAHMIAAHPGEVPETARSHRLAWEDPVAALREGRTYIVEDLEALPDNVLTRALRAQGLRSFAAVPLVVGDELIGVLSLTRDESGRLVEESLQIVEDLADQLAIGIHQAQLHERVERYAGELESEVSARTAQLRASEARFRTIFEQAAIGVTLADMDGRLITSNPAFRTMLGYDDRELRGVLHTEITHPEDREVSEMMLRELLEGERDRYTLEKRYVDTEGEVVWGRLVVSVIRSEEGLPQYVISMVEDITQWKRAQAAMMQSEKLAMTGQLAASLAHEINNPLQTVIGCLGLAEEAMDDGAPVDDFLSIATEELQRTARIVSRLRDLGRPVDAKVAREPADLNEIVERTLAVSQKELQNHGIVTETAFSEPLPKPTVIGDRIGQVILNLILNAKDAMAEGGRLYVRTYYDETAKEACIEVADEGSGMSPEVMDRLFDPFFSTKQDGMGLGLFVSHHIVEEHQGCIDVYSESGQGTTFTVRLPVESEKPVETLSF